MTMQFTHMRNTIAGNVITFDENLYKKGHYRGMSAEEFAAEMAKRPNTPQAHPACAEGENQAAAPPTAPLAADSEKEGDEPENRAPATDLNAMTLEQLHSYSCALGLQINKKAKKEDIITEILRLAEAKKNG